MSYIVIQETSSQIRIASVNNCDYLSADSCMEQSKKHSNRVPGDRISAHSWSEVPFYGDVDLNTSF